MDVNTTTQATVSVSEVATGADGTPAAVVAKLIAGKDSNGDQQDVAVGTDGKVLVTPDLPTNAATETKQDSQIIALGSLGTKLDTLHTDLDTVEGKQDTGNTSLSSIDGKIMACNTGAVTVSSSALPTGAATAANQVMATITSGALYIDLSTINGSGGALVTVAATVAVAVRVLSFTNVSGNNIGVYDGSTLVAVIGAGADNQIGVNIASGHDVKLRMMGTSAGAAGDILCLNLMG